MKRTLLYILSVACILWNIGCTEKTYIVPIEEDYDVSELPETYKSYWYYSYDALEVIDYQTLGLEAATDFSPYTVAHRGDTLFIANNAAGRSLIVFDKKEHRPLKTIATWNVGDAAKNFTSDINAIFPAGDRLYVAERQSLIHVFSLPGLEYLSCIGNGEWQGPVFQAQAMTVKDGLIFARNKDGKVRIYKESDVTPENYQKINYYKEAGPGAGDSSNNQWAAHYMEVDSLGRILLTGYVAKSIRVLDPSLVNDDFKNGTNLDIAEQTYAVPFNPKTFATTSDRMYVTGSNDAINVYDCASKEWVKTFKSIKGYTFTKAERIYGEDEETFWVSDVTKRTVVKMCIFKAEIREYDFADANTLKVQSATTRNGNVEEEFYVDIRTHEIVDPAEAE